MKSTLIRTLIIAMLLATPSITLAAGLTSPQVNAVLGLLRAFNVQESLIASVAGILAPADPIPTSSPIPPVTFTRPDTNGSPYTPGSLGYDLSFNTLWYPQVSSNFVVIGATAGKAYTYNERARSEYSFAQSGSIRPTIYLNLNAPYGSTATSTNISAPHVCDMFFGAATTSASAGGTYPEPTVCASYNYGYNAAKGAYDYMSGVGISSPFWWLDVEEANSWSPDVAVNDAVIQGAIDYLNSAGIRAGVYSVPYMWRNIAGNSFAPIQSLSGRSVTTPTWFPIGIATEVEALNACLFRDALIPGNPIWVIQYEADSTAVDQNIAC